VAAFRRWADSFCADLEVIDDDLGHGRLTDSPVNITYGFRRVWSNRAGRGSRRTPEAMHTVELDAPPPWMEEHGPRTREQGLPPDDVAADHRASTCSRRSTATPNRAT
jgi:hypothetical protein